MEAFIKPIPVPRIFKNSGLTAFASDFDLHHYSESLYSELNINLPDDLENALPKKKAEFLAGRYCAKRALHEFGIKHDFILEKGPSRAPLWPRALTGSITHSEGRCFVVVGRKEQIRSVGIDTEDLILRKNEIDRVETAISTPKETHLLNRLAKETDRTVLIGTLFTIKESVYKSIQPLTGATIHFEDIEVIELDFNAGHAQWKTTRDLGPGFPEGTKGLAQFEWDGRFMHAIVVIHS